jgi:hypothetical protein
MPGDRLPAGLAVVFSLPAAVFLPLAQAADDPDADELSQVVITGTRVQNRSALETAVPVNGTVGRGAASVDLNTGTAAFSNYSPFDRSGRFISGRLSYDF